MRTPHGQYPEYHTSADNLDFVKAENLSLSLAMYLNVIYVLENNRRYLNQNPKCEPQLGKRGIYDKIGGQEDKKAFQLAMLWVLNQADGNHTLLDISERAKLDFDIVLEAANILVQHNLLIDIDKA
jgi:aminopeptidase-like protein